eukprot:TRINITY_DN13527_c0_g1_i1.p3 TRINITY_DN13527_c0_g1~~TRINITY_DN13527_c0_g1_i1.p3  ORF type:complete len:378 (-),score=25.15 TRINITY_DN13527_c0_g1_i1:941-2074(-)
MYCTWCRERKFDNMLSRGTNKFTKKNLDRHEDNNEHKSTKGPKPDTKVAPIIKAIYGDHKQAMINLFKAAYYIAVECISYKKYESLVNLLGDVKCVVPTTYYHDRKNCAELIGYISSAIDSEILNTIKRSTSFGLMVDESVDMTQEEHVVLYAKYYDIDKELFKTAFLKLLKIPNAKSLTLHKVIKSYLREAGLNIGKMASICTDGAANMASVKDGLIGLFHLENPGIVFTHCVAHRVSLAMKDAIKKIPYIILYSDLVRNIHAYFARSALRTEKLKEIFASKEESFAKIPELFTIRWISLYPVVTKIMQGYDPLYEYFYQNSKQDATAMERYQEGEVRFYNRILIDDSEGNLHIIKTVPGFHLLGADTGFTHRYSY